MTSNELCKNYESDFWTRIYVDFQIPRSSEGKEWFQYTDKDMTFELLEGIEIQMAFVQFAAYFGWMIRQNL